MKELEVIGKEIEIYKIKLFMFMAIAGGSWVYLLKYENKYFAVILVFVFAIATIGVIANTLKLSNLQSELKRIKR